MHTADEPAWYEIRFQGHLDDRWAALFDGLSLEPQPDGVCVLRGRIVDQAALHGVLARLRDLGVPLLSITSNPSDPGRAIGNPGPSPRNTPSTRPSGASA